MGNFTVKRDSGLFIGDVDVAPASGTIEITENGEYDVARYATADVDVPQPSGKINITENGTDIDVSQYATADVNVSQGGGIDVRYYISTYDVQTLTAISTNNKMTLTLPDEVEAIGEAVFNGNKFIGTVICPDGFLEIPSTNDYFNSPFYRSGVEAIYLGKSLTLLGDNAIYASNQLRKIYIPKTLSELGNNAIYLLPTSEINIYYEGTQAEWEAITGMPSGGISGAIMHYEYSGNLSDFLNE